MEGGSVRRSVVWNVSCPVGGQAKHNSSTSENAYSTTLVNKTGLPYARRRLLGTCQSTPGGGKHYQHDDEHCHYLPYRDNAFQCSAWRHEYPRRPQKEVKYTNND